MQTVSDMDLDMCQIFSFFITLSVLHVETCDTSMERCVLGLHFFFLHPRALSNLWGRYDIKAKKKYKFLACNCVISSHRIKCNIY